MERWWTKYSNKKGSIKLEPFLILNPTLEEDYYGLLFLIYSKAKEETKIMIFHKFDELVFEFSYRDYYTPNEICPLFPDTSNKHVQYRTRDQAWTAYQILVHKSFMNADFEGAKRLNYFSHSCGYWHVGHRKNNYQAGLTKPAWSLRINTLKDLCLKKLSRRYRLRTLFTPTV